MKPSEHTVISVVTSGIFYAGTHSWPGTVMCFLSGIFIDLDHHLDFVLNKGRFPWKYPDLWSFAAEEKDGKFFLIFHSYELFAVLWFAVLYFHLDPVWFGMMVGATVHMIADQAANPASPLAYFFIYRLKHGFEKKWVFDSEYYKTLKK